MKVCVDGSSFAHRVETMKEERCYSIRVEGSLSVCLTRRSSHNFLFSNDPSNSIINPFIEAQV